MQDVPCDWSQNSSKNVFFFFFFLLPLNEQKVCLFSATEVAEDLRKQILSLYSAFLSKDGKVSFLL